VTPDKVAILDTAEDDVRVGLMVALAFPDLQLEQELLRTAETLLEGGRSGRVEADGSVRIAALGDEDGRSVQELDEAARDAKDRLHCQVGLEKERQTREGSQRACKREALTSTVSQSLGAWLGSRIACPGGPWLIETKSNLRQGVYMRVSRSTEESRRSGPDEPPLGSCREAKLCQPSGRK
jgi:hypothetical protein